MNFFGSKSFWPFIVLVFFIFSAYGQEKKRFNGPFQIGSYAGDAVYDFLISDLDTIFDGTFQLQNSNMEISQQERDASFMIRGAFGRGVATGPWLFHFNDFKSEEERQLVDFEYRVLVSGVQESGSGNVVNGKPDGQWVYELNRIKASEIVSALFKSDITFAKGIPGQNFKIESDSTVLVGRFLRNGLAHDEWSSFAVNSVEDTEDWLFEDGLLLKIVQVVDGTSTEIPIFKKANQNLKTIVLDESYLKVIRSAAKRSGASLMPANSIMGLLRQNERYYSKLNDILLALGSEGFVPQYQVKVPYHPLNSAQMDKLTAIAGNYKAAKTIAAQVLTNSHLNIVKRSNQEVRYNYRAAAAVSRAYLDPLSNLVDAQEEGILEFLDIPSTIQNLWTSGRPEKKLKVSMDSLPSKTFVLPNASDFDFEANELDGIQQITEYARASMEKLKEALSEHLSAEESIQALNFLEVDLIAKNDSLKTLLQSYRKELPKNYTKALDAIADFSERSLQEYATTTAPEKKLIFGNTFDNCMGALLQLTKNVGKLPTKIAEIDSLYTDAVFNPFMATVMEEDVKKRITNAYSKTIIPYFLDGIVKGLSCTTAKNFSEKMQTVHEQVRSLRKEDTRKLERKLRREKRPEVVLRLVQEFIPIKLEEK